MNYFQQGDVLIKPFDELPTWRKEDLAQREKKELSELIVAEGENTGHAHKITGKIINFVPKHSRRTETIVFELLEDAVISHEEHNSFTMPAGTYYIEQVREWDHFDNTSRRVVD